MTEKPSEAVVSAWVALARAGRLATARVEERLKCAQMPPLSWYDALWELEKAGEGGLRPFELEKALLFQQYNLSRLADRLETAGLIARCACPQDRRGQVLKITEQGRALRRQMWVVYAEAIEEAIGTRLSEEEAGRLASLLCKLQ
ncbi:MarR family winged helix-turn-helix transcriptional regulator [Chelativorans intermedius]|uniref:MarR family winged helix-turn-helix transcriptional regulator n=1 Tax=Chelativorans intermedius TaxID=515947 RepID=A0ABV6D894_9HYPH|nr:MarR family transcriptional regulator [Chelativorans intermedius]MCT8996829.1 MarR family transcriptional regulator [Chelativorans intermedius]